MNVTVRALNNTKWVTTQVQLGKLPSSIARQLKGETVQKPRQKGVGSLLNSDHVSQVKQS